MRYPLAGGGAAANRSTRTSCCCSGYPAVVDLVPDPRLRPDGDHKETTYGVLNNCPHGLGVIDQPLTILPHQPRGLYRHFVCLSAVYGAPAIDAA